LLDFAEQSEFDPLVSDNWYNVDRAKLLQHKVLFPIGDNTSNIKTKQGVHKVAAYHGGVIRALKALFPEVKFNSKKFCFKKSIKY
jgi:hypothetical protein